AILDGGGHRHGAGDMFAGLERCDRLPGVVGNRRVDMDGVYFWVLEKLLKVGVPFFHAESIADGIKFFAGALANGIHFGIGMALINGDELGSKSKANNGHVSGTHGSGTNNTFVQGNCQRKMPFPEENDWFWPREKDRISRKRTEGAQRFWQKRHGFK